jgi:hypothetical protein
MNMSLEIVGRFIVGFTGECSSDSIKNHFRSFLLIGREQLISTCPQINFDSIFRVVHGSTPNATNKKGRATSGSALCGDV